jgi:hypothetical protein
VGLRSGLVDEVLSQIDALHSVGICDTVDVGVYAKKGSPIPLLGEMCQKLFDNI